MRKVYLDNAATTALHPEVVEAMIPYLRDVYGNPHSVHSWGGNVHEALEIARSQMAKLIGGKPEEIIFTSSPTESSNLAIKGLAQAYESRGKHIIISAIEHSPLMNSARNLEKSGFSTTIVPVDEYGLVKLEELASSIRKDTILVSIQQANGEVGTIQDMKAISALLEGKGILFHTDAESSAGIIPANVSELGVDAMTIGPNQFYGPKGAGALWLRSGVDIVPLIEGGVAEGSRRAGIEDVPAIVGMGKAAEIARRDMSTWMEHTSRLRDRLIAGVKSQIGKIVLTGHPTQRLPRTVSFCVEYIEGEAVLAFMDSEGIAAGSGSACASNVLKDSSHVLDAMGISPTTARGALLFTVSAETTEADIDYVLEVLPPIVERLRQMSPLYRKSG